jgi:hypothetical protein
VGNQAHVLEVVGGVFVTLGFGIVLARSWLSDGNNALLAWLHRKGHSPRANGISAGQRSTPLTMAVIGSFFVVIGGGSLIAGGVWPDSGNGAAWIGYGIGAAVTAPLLIALAVLRRRDRGEGTHY